MRRDLPNRSSVGGLFVNRQGTGDLAPANDYNRTYAVDGRWGIGQNGLVQGFVGRTETPGRTGREEKWLPQLVQAFLEPVPVRPHPRIHPRPVDEPRPRDLPRPPTILKEGIRTSPWPMVSMTASTIA